MGEGGKKYDTDGKKTHSSSNYASKLTWQLLSAVCAKPHRCFALKLSKNEAAHAGIADEAGRGGEGVEVEPAAPIPSDTASSSVRMRARANMTLPSKGAKVGAVGSFTLDSAAVAFWCCRNC